MLVDDVGQACRNAWSAYRKRFADESPYAFGLYVVSEDGLIVGSAYATEEATTSRAEEYAFVLGGDTQTRARAIRWLDADWPHCNDLRDEFAAVNDRIRREGQSPTELREIYERVLGDLDRQGCFESARDRVILAVFGPDRDRSIERLNAEPTVARFRAEVSEGERLYRALQL